jgi:hypothetical protein
MPRSALAEFLPPRNRPDPVDLLESQAASRIADLLPVRYGDRVAIAGYLGTSDAADGAGYSPPSSFVSSSSNHALT